MKTLQLLSTSKLCIIVRLTYLYLTLAHFVKVKVKFTHFNANIFEMVKDTTNTIVAVR